MKLRQCYRTRSSPNQAMCSLRSLASDRWLRWSVSLMLVSDTVYRVRPSERMLAPAIASFPQQRNRSCTVAFPSA